MRPTTVVSSANLMKWFELYLVQQSCVISVNSRGDNTHPWGTPVFTMMVSEEFLPTLTVCGLSVRKSSSQLQNGVLMPISLSLFTRCWGMMKVELKSMLTSVEGRTEVNEQHPHVGKLLAFSR